MSYDGNYKYPLFPPQNMVVISCHLLLCFNWQPTHYWGLEKWHQGQNQNHHPTATVLQLGVRCSSLTSSLAADCKQTAPLGNSVLSTLWLGWNTQDFGRSSLLCGKTQAGRWATALDQWAEHQGLWRGRRTSQITVEALKSSEVFFHLLELSEFSLSDLLMLGSISKAHKSLTEHELWADAYLFINIFYFMLLIVPDAGKGNDFQMRRLFLSLEHSYTWNANFNQLLDGEIRNRSAISAGFPFIPISAVGLCPLEEIWIVCKII